MCLAASLVLLKRARREGGFIRPFWRRGSAGKPVTIREFVATGRPPPPQRAW